MTIQEQIAVMQAFVDGKQIEAKHKDIGEWNNASSPNWDWSSTIYRIKPEPKLRPYDCISEFIQAQKEHGPYLYKRVGYLDMPLRIVPDGIVLNSHYSSFKSEARTDIYFWADLAKNYHWQDGSPCGILE